MIVKVAARTLLAKEVAVAMPATATILRFVREREGKCQVADSREADTCTAQAQPWREDLAVLLLRPIVSWDLIGAGDGEQRGKKSYATTRVVQKEFGPRQCQEVCRGDV